MIIRLRKSCKAQRGNDKKKNQMVGIDKTSVTASRIINARLYPAVSRPFPSTRVTHTGCSRSTDLWFMKVRNVFSTKYGRAIDSSQNSLDSGAEQYRRRALSFVEKKKEKVFSRFPPPVFFLSLSPFGEREEETIVIFLCGSWAGEVTEKGIPLHLMQLTRY